MGKSAKRKKEKAARKAAENDDPGGTRVESSEETSGSERKESMSAEGGGIEKSEPLPGKLTKTDAKVASTNESSAKVGASNGNGEPMTGKSSEALPNDRKSQEGGPPMQKHAAPTAYEENRTETMKSIRDELGSGRSPAAEKPSAESLKEALTKYERDREARLESIPAKKPRKGAPASVRPNRPPGDGSWIEDRGYPSPVIDNHEGPVEGKPAYKGFKGTRDAMPMRQADRAAKPTKKHETAGVYYGIKGNRMLHLEPFEAADEANADLIDECEYWTYPTLLDVAGVVGEKTLQPMYQCKVAGKIQAKRGYADSVNKPTYVEICRGECKQPYVVQSMTFETLDSAIYGCDPGSVVNTPAGLWVVQEWDSDDHFIEPANSDMMTYVLKDRRELIPIASKPLEESMVRGPDDRIVEVIDYPRNHGLTFHHPKLAKVETPSGPKDVMFPPFNRDAAGNEMFHWITDVIQDGHFLWSVEAEHTICRSPPRAIWFGRDLWAGGVIDIDDRKTVHALPGFVVLTDKQIEAKRSFGCLTLENAKWIDMAERLLRRQHFLHGGNERFEKQHVPGQAGPLSIYLIDEDIRPEDPANYLPETMRWVDTALPKGYLINMQNSAVYMVTCAAKGRELCRARAELKKTYKSLENCYEEMFGQAEAALDARFRAAAECFRLAKRECIKASYDLAWLADNQARMYTPSYEMSRALVHLATIDTLTMSRDEMQMYTGNDEASRKRECERYEIALSVNPSAIIGLPMPANDLSYLWLKLMSVLQASLLHLDVVMLCGMHDEKAGESVEWLPNQAAYLMGQARDEFERASVEDVLPRVKALFASDRVWDILKVNLLQKMPEKGYKERAMQLEHPPCVAWRYVMPRHWDECAVFPRLAGLSHEPIGEQKQLVDASRRRSETQSRQEEYVDTLAAANVESVRRDEWDPDREVYWSERVTSSIYRGEAWIGRRKQLGQVFTKVMLRKMRKYMADEPVCAITKALRDDVKKPIDDVEGWFMNPPYDPEDLPSDEEDETVETEQEGERREATPPSRGARLTEDNSTSESSTEGGPPIKEESFVKYENDPLPPSTASESSMVTVRQKAPVSGNLAANPTNGGDAQVDTTKASEGEQVPSQPAGNDLGNKQPQANQVEEAPVEEEGENDPDFFTITLSLNAKEYYVQPTIEEWREMPEDVHWNVLQPRPKPRLLSIAYNVTEKEQSEIAMVELEKVKPTTVGGEKPVRSKTKVQSVVEQATMEAPNDWQDKAAIQLSTKGRFEYILSSNDYFPIAQSICYREARTGYGEALEVALAKPAVLPGAVPAEQPKAKQRELLTQHNAETEAWRGVVAIMDTHLSQGYVDLYAAKLPYDRVMVYDNFMLITQSEWNTLDKSLTAMKMAMSELKALEQHCYVPIEGRSFYIEADRKLREVATHLIKFAEIVQQGRSRALRQVEEARLVETQEELQQCFQEWNEKNENVPLEDPKSVVMVQFANMKRWSSLGGRAETVAVSFHTRPYVWAYLPTPMIRSTDMVDPEGFMKEESGAILASCMMLLGVRVFGKDVLQGELHWFCPGFFCRALGEKNPDGGPRDAECLQLFRTRSLRHVVLLDYELQAQTGLQSSEAWLAERCYRRITNRPDDEYKNRNEYNAYGPSAYLLNVTTSDWRKMTGKPPGTPGVVGEIESIPGVKCGYRCRGCHTRMYPSTSCQEYCLYRTENHQFGSIMLKHWCVPESKRPLPEIHEKERQFRAIQDRRLTSALETYNDPQNELTLKEIAAVYNIPCNILTNALQTREEPAETGWEKWQREVSRLEEWNSSAQNATELEPCSKCGGFNHKMTNCMSGSAARALHASRVLNQLVQPTPRNLPLHLMPMGENWREDSLKRMKSGTMQVAPPINNGSAMDPMQVATRSTTYASVLTKGGPQGRPSPEPASREPSFAKSTGSGRPTSGAYRRSTYGSGWAASQNQQSYSGRMTPGNARSAGQGFHKSYAGQPAYGAPPAPRQPTEQAPAQEIVDKYCPDIDAGVLMKCYPPPDMKLPTGWDFVVTENGQKPRKRARETALLPKVNGGFHSYFDIDEELSRAVYENKGFMPALLRKCAQHGFDVPDVSIPSDRRVPCKTAALGVIGREEVWTKWNADQRKRHVDFYKSATYAELSKQWCLQCLCPGHLASACRRYRTGTHKLLCNFCGDGTHDEDVCPLKTNGVGCDQCGSENHGRLMCGHNEPLYGDATCSVRIAILGKYAKYLPQFHADSGGHKAMIASDKALTSKNGRKHLSEMMRVLGVLEVDEGYY